MRTLPERDVAALLSVVGELAALDDALAFPPHFLERLGRLMNCSAVGYSELDRARKRSVLQCEWVEGEGLVTPPSEHDEDEVFRLLFQHPVCGYRTRTWDWTSPYKISDFATLREFRRTEIWARVYRDEEPRVNHWIDVGLSGPLNRLVESAVARLGDESFYDPFWHSYDSALTDLKEEQS